MTYHVMLTNFGTKFADTFKTFEDAVKFAKTKGFEATISEDDLNEIAGTWSPIGGARRWHIQHDSHVNEYEYQNYRRIHAA